MFENCEPVKNLINMEKLSEHIEGMLDRDQRTAMCISTERFNVVERTNDKGYPQSINNNNNNILYQNKAISHQQHHCTIPRTLPQISSCKTRINRQFWNKFFQRLKHVLIVGTYISLVIFPSASSAPTKRHLNSAAMSDRMDSVPQWVNPCGPPAEIPSSPSPTTELPELVKKDMIRRIIRQAINTKNRIDHLKTEFMHHTQQNWDELYNQYGSKDYDWLPTKNLPKPLHTTYLEELEFEPTIKEIYKQLQMIAVGLEQMIWDEEDQNGALKSTFQKAQAHLLGLLCEIQNAIVDLNFKQHPDVSRDIMDPKLRGPLDQTNTIVRNWIIYKDYMIMVDYVLEVFKHFETRPKL